MNKFPIAINNFSFILFGYKKSWFNNIEGDGSNPIPNPFRPMSPALPSTPSNSGSAFAVHACRVYARWPLLLLIFHSPSLYSNHNYYSHNHWNDESKRHMLVAHSGCQPKKQPPLFKHHPNEDVNWNRNGYAGPGKQIFRILFLIADWWQVSIPFNIFYR